VRDRLRALGNTTLTDLPVRTPSGHDYIVRLRRRSPIERPTAGDPASMAADLVRKNLKAMGDTGWDVLVIRPATRLRAERKLFSQHIEAKALIVDVTMTVYDALERGDSLWDED
jgi:hypothetical protein